jgi:succinate-semialdehyde dehydrogenase / glutarate-semialdehyde dehydrogenase
MAIESINPATGKLLRQFEPLTDEAARQKIALAAEAFRTYALIPIEHRALWMRKLASILDNELDDLSTLITLEMGKPIEASRYEILKCADACRYYAEHAARILAPESIPTEHNHSYVRWDPLGVVLAVMPWNFPFWQVFRFLAPALMAGNVAVLKHAPNVPQCALAIEALVRRAGFPRGTFQSLFLDVQQVETILGDERIVAVTVTGSEAAGRAIGAQAGWLIKKSVLELGGSDPFIVMPSADLDLAIETAIRARCVNSGQSCIAAKRFIVADEIYDVFESRFVAGMEAIRVGDPMKPEIQVGPLATAHAVDLLEEQVKAATRVGARILTGGERMLGAGNYFEPTVITGIPRNSAVYREELFGPVAMLFRAQDLNEAIEIANDTPFGLGASAWTRDPAEQQRFVTELQCGGVFLNTMVASDPRLPFGGIKRSGYGRELSAAGMREFLNAKTVVIASAGSTHEAVSKPYLVSTADTLQTR